MKPHPPMTGYHHSPPGTLIRRRDFSKSALGVAVAATQALQTHSSEAGPHPSGKATSCILLWMGGGMCHVDTFDPKVQGDPQTGKAGSAYPSIPTAIPDVRVCEHLSRTARLLDRGVLLRTVHHALSIDHADATNLIKTGRLTDGSLVYPSIGSIVTHLLGPRDPDIPPYIVMGLPNVTRGPGFLGAENGFVYLTDTQTGPVGLRLPSDVGQIRNIRRHALLDTLRDHLFDQARTGPKKDYDAAIEKAHRLVHGKFSEVFKLEQEPSTLRERYGDEFGQRCLLARRLVESGARFVEAAFNLNFVNGTGWDTHRKGHRNQHVLIQQLDQSLSTLIEDLESRKLLDETLVIVGTEFGRPAHFDNEGGRGHQSSAFTFTLFGGGLRTGQCIGVTDELGAEPIERPISVPDLHATILAALGIDPAHELYADSRPVPVTNHGTPIQELFS